MGGYEIEIPNTGIFDHANLKSFLRMDVPSRRAAKKWIIASGALDILFCLFIVKVFSYLVLF